VVSAQKAEHIRNGSERPEAAYGVFAAVKMTTVSDDLNSR